MERMGHMIQQTCAVAGKMELLVQQDPATCPGLIQPTGTQGLALQLLAGDG